MVFGFGRRRAQTTVDAEGKHSNGHHHGHGHGHHDHEHRPRQEREGRAHLIISVLTSFFTLVTFILFLLVGLGLPIIKDIWLLTLHAKPYNLIVTSVATEIRFGTWGYCAIGELGPSLCIGPNLGYSLTDPINIASFVGQPSLTNAIQKVLTVVLVLHPVCAGIAFVLFALCWIKKHAASIFALIVAIVLALAGSISLAIDLALVIVAKDKVPDATSGNFTVTFGNGVWMVLAAVVCSWACVIVISVRACLCCGLRVKF